MGVQVFQCHTGNSLKKLFNKSNVDKMFVQIDDTQGDVRITGKAYICNEDGKNEYVSQFDHLAKDIISVRKDEFQGKDALVMFMKIPSIYGSKKIQIILPDLANLNQALGIISDYVKPI